MELLRTGRVYSIAEIRAVSRQIARNLELILWPAKLRYIFDPASTADDDGFNVLAPNEAAGGCSAGGRWVLESSPPGSDDDSGRGGGGGSGITILEAEDVAGHGGAGGADITDATLTFTLAADADVAIWGEGTAALDFLNRTSAALGIDVDGTQYNGTEATSSTLGNRQTSPVVAFKKVSLAAGTHTIKLFGGGSIGVDSDAGRPTRLLVVY
jgi:hypothetical protein